MKVNGNRFLTLLIAFIVSACCLPLACWCADERGIVQTVVIDAGHGGKDPGTMYGAVKEKDIALAVALQLGELINRNYPDVKVVYTRKTDVFIELAERTNIANRAKADLFISIHVNGAKSTAASGTETYIMGEDKNGRNLSVAMRENDVITYEEDYSAKYEGFTPGSAESYIIFSLMQYSYQEQSRLLASYVQQHYTGSVKLTDRGVKQGQLLVLWRTSMPSILTELGFISNDKDRKMMTTKDGQAKYARCIFNAFSAYKTKTDGNGKLIVLKDATSSAGDSSSVYTAATSSVPARIIYCVQVATSSKKLGQNSPRFGSYKGKTTERNVNGTWKYYVGEYSSYDEAAKNLKTVKREISDAFVVAFSDGMPIAIGDARRLAGQ